MTTPTPLRCTVCDGKLVSPILRIDAVPVHCNLIWSDHASALRAPRGDIALASCPQCGHVFNSAFDPAPVSYTQEYENSLHFSPRFQRYAEELADWLIAEHRIREKDIVELGCGQGDFLALMVSHGRNRGIGFDPSFIPPLAYPHLADRMRIVQDFYSPRYSHYAADLVLCRQVLEHLPNPGEFIRNVREAVGQRADTVVFFEVPNALYTLRDKGIWDLIYEHCSYFSAASLTEVFRKNGFAVGSVRELYGGQFLGLDARIPAGSAARPTPQGESAETVARYAEEFASIYTSKVTYWRENLQSLQAKGKTAVVWGSGSKGVTFLNTLGAPAAITHVVDINPRKQGKFVAGTGQEIVPPEALIGVRPDVVIIMNSIYMQEIRSTLDALGVTAQILTA
jgi:SAM-dependent methyltransferase